MTSVGYSNDKKDANAHRLNQASDLIAAFKKGKVPVSTKALYQRINRKLREYDQVLKRSRVGAIHNLGLYYVLDLKRNCYRERHIDLEDYGRKLGVLQPFEALVR